MHVHDGQVRPPPLLHILICVQPHQQKVTQFPCFLQQRCTAMMSGALWQQVPAEYPISVTMPCLLAGALRS